MTPSINGLLLLNKEAGMTSQTAVTRVRRLYGADKAGHTGTLDPMATGVLPVLLGRAVKASEYLVCTDKHYLAVLRLGLRTDTEDITGTLLSTAAAPLPGEEIVRAVCARFLGEYRQVPPMYSALKRDGHKLVDLARAGITVEREARTVHIGRLEVTPLGGDEYRLDVICTKGTYIRTLCADIGAALGCGGVMSALCRAEAAGFSLVGAHTLGEIEASDEAARAALVLPVEDLFPAWEKLTLPPFFAHLAHSGAQVYLHKLGRSLPVGTRLRLYDGEGFFAIGEVRTYPEGDAVKPLKQFS